MNVNNELMNQNKSFNSKVGVPITTVSSSVAYNEP